MSTSLFDRVVGRLERVDGLDVRLKLRVGQHLLVPRSFSMSRDLVRRCSDRKIRRRDVGVESLERRGRKKNQRSKERLGREGVTKTNLDLLL